MALKVTVVIDPAFSELTEALQKVPPRLRAERLRMLATMGVMASKYGLNESDQPKLKTKETANQTKEDSAITYANKLMGKL
jgi:hypothetical protein